MPHIYTDEQKQFILDNANVCTTRQLTDLVNTKFNLSLSAKQIKSYCEYRGINTIKIHDSHYYTDIEDTWIRDNWDNANTYQEIADKFNTTFNLSLSKSIIMRHCVTTLGLQKKGNPLYISYSQDEYDYIREQYFKCDTYKELTDKVNDKFHNNRTVSQISDTCTKRLKLPINHMKNGGRYLQGDKSRELPIGTIRKSQTGTYIKVMNTGGGVNITGYIEPYWLPLQKKIYQDAYGEIPDGYMVCFLDGNPDNFDLSNLYCINRKISANMSSHSWWTTDREHTLTAIKWCELYYALKNVRELTNAE